MDQNARLFLNIEITSKKGFDAMR